MGASELSKIRSENAKKQWANPDIKNKMLNTLMKTNASPESFLKRSASQKKRWTDPEYRIKKIIQVTDQWLVPDIRDRMSRSNKETKCDPNYREELIKKLKFYKESGYWYGSVKHYDTPQYCEKFNPEFRKRVRAYWGNLCVECGSPRGKKNLCVHHVHYAKKMCCNGSPQDVVPLCTRCHMKTNFNRDYWEEHYTELIYSLHPEGKCFFTKEEMQNYIHTHAQ